MGHHVADKMSSMLIYGRDNTTDAVLDAIKGQNFRPDSNRAGMFPGWDDCGKKLAQDESGFDGHCSDSSSEDSVDEDASGQELIAP